MTETRWSKVGAEEMNDEMLEAVGTGFRDP